MVARAGGVGAGDVNHHERDRLELLEANAIAWTSFVRRHAHVQPVAVALRCDGSGITYLGSSTPVSTGSPPPSPASARGAGGRVAILMANRTEYVEALGGIMRLGAIAVPLNFRLVAAEVAHLLHDSGATLLVVDEERADTAAEAVAVAGGDAPVVVVGDGAAPGAAHGWADIFDDGSGTPPLSPDIVAAWEPAAPAFIMYTSGTTGRPKGAVLSHFNLIIGNIPFTNMKVEYGHLRLGRRCGSPVCLCSTSAAW